MINAPENRVADIEAGRWSPPSARRSRACPVRTRRADTPLARAVADVVLAQLRHHRGADLCWYSRRLRRFRGQHGRTDAPPGRPARGRGRRAPPPAASPMGSPANSMITAAGPARTAAPRCRRKQGVDAVSAGRRSARRRICSTGGRFRQRQARWRGEQHQRLAQPRQQDLHHRPGVNPAVAEIALQRLRRPRLTTVRHRPVEAVERLQPLRIGGLSSGLAENIRSIGSPASARSGCRAQRGVFPSPPAPSRTAEAGEDQAGHPLEKGRVAAASRPPRVSDQPLGSIRKLRTSSSLLGRGIAGAVDPPRSRSRQVASACSCTPAAARLSHALRKRCLVEHHEAVRGPPHPPRAAPDTKDAWSRPSAPGPATRRARWARPQLPSDPAVRPQSPSAVLRT